MDSAELRALQQPLKDAYRDDPEQAVVTLRARGQLDDAVSCSVETGQALAVAGLHPATGGDGTLLCSGDMLLQALVACAGVTLRAVATSLGIDVAGGTVSAEGDLDFRGTLAVSKDAPVGFRSIRLAFDLDTDASAEQVQTLIRLTERYCVVYQTLSHPAEMTISAEAPAGSPRELTRRIRPRDFIGGSYRPGAADRALLLCRLPRWHHQHRGIRCECPIHAAGTTWLGHPRRMNGRGQPRTGGGSRERAGARESRGC
jgi:uncharacterized OsmC-like protein